MPTEEVLKIFEDVITFFKISYEQYGCIEIYYKEETPISTAKFLKLLNIVPCIYRDLIKVIENKSEYIELLDKIRDFEEAMAEFADGGIYIQVSDVLNLLHKYIEEV